MNVHKTSTTTSICFSHGIRGLRKRSKGCRRDVELRDSRDKRIVRAREGDTAEEVEEKLSVGSRRKGTSGARKRASQVRVRSPSVRNAPVTYASTNADGTRLERIKEFLWGDFKTRGLLYWMNRLTFATIMLGFTGWVCFRFIGPSLGLYELVDPFDQPRY